MKIIRATTLVLCSFILVGISSPTAAQKTDEFNLDETYPIDDNGIIELQSNDADRIEIIGSDRDDVHVVINYKLSVEGLRIGDRDEFEMVVNERDGDLEIREKSEDSRNFSINLGKIEEDYTIRIEAPRDVNLAIGGDDDNYEISEIFGYIHINADDAEIALNQCRGNQFKFNLDDGELTMDGGGTGLLEIDFDDGDAEVRNGEFNRVNIDMDDGDVFLETTLAEDGDYDFSFDDGSLDLVVLGGGGEFWVDHDGINVSADSEFEETRSEEDYNEYRLPGGNARVRINTDDGDVRLSVQ